MCLMNLEEAGESVDGSAEPITTAGKPSDWLEVKKSIFLWS